MQELLEEEWGGWEQENKKEKKKKNKNRYTRVLTKEKKSRKLATNKVNR